MNEQRLREELQRTPIDDGARARALRVALAAYEASAAAAAPLGARARRRRVPARRRRGGALRAARPATPWRAGCASVLGEDRPQARPALVRVPGGGRLLVTGPRRRVGGLGRRLAPPARRLRRRVVVAATGSSSSAWRGGELLALEPGGAVRWSLDRTGRIGAAAGGRSTASASPT